MGVKPFLIALDLDGTLLKSDKTIDRSTAIYLRKLAKQHHLVLATGRPFRSSKKYYDQLQLTTPMICYNGAFITHPHDALFPSSSFAFPQDVVKKIVDDVGLDIIDNIMCETNEKIWLLKEEHELEDFFWHKHMTMIYGHLGTTLHENPMTMILKSKERNDVSDERIRHAVKKHTGLSIRFWGDSVFSEIYFSHISKGSALQQLLAYFNLSKDQLIAFGDAENDREMLFHATHSFAMKNAVDSMKKIAKKTTQFDNNHQGIKETLQAFFNEHRS